MIQTFFNLLGYALGERYHSGLVTLPVVVFLLLGVFLYRSVTI